MGSWLALSNVVEVVAAWAVTAFGIPWFNKRFHTNIPDPPLPKTEEEISALAKYMMAIWEPVIAEHLRHYHALQLHQPTPSSPASPAPYTTFTTTNTAPTPPAAMTNPDTGATNA